MRAFVQTFVLAPETPKKYYVHNDIFRYQDDDIVSESETNETSGKAKFSVYERERERVSVLLECCVGLVMVVKAKGIIVLPTMHTVLILLDGHTHTIHA